MKAKEKKKRSFKRSVIKRSAKKNIKRHYIRNILIIFLTSFIINGGYLLNTDNLQISEITFQDTTYEISGKKSNMEIISEFVSGQTEEHTENEKSKTNYTKGVLNVFINETTRSGSLVFGFLNAFNQLYLHGRVSAFVTILIFTVISFAIFSLIQNIIVVGKNRYFLEQRKYLNTGIDRILFPYKVKKTLHLSYILFCKYIYQTLWNFTIIGGFIKHYEYFFIPYLLAENPTLTKKEAFKLSKELMKGEKWNAFKLDFSFIGWEILESFTFGLSSVFFFYTYRECTYAELYISIRIAKQNSISNPKLLTDTLLFVSDTMEDSYPEENLPTSVTKNSIFQKLDYKQNYDISSYILFFFTFAFVGWCWEVFLHLANDGVFVNRGTMFGPWLPIYGTGGLLILILLKPVRTKPTLLFCLAFILCGILEYSTAWYLETFQHMKWWDYTGYFLNIHGRTCLEVLIVFGLGGCAFTYLFAPLLNNIYKKFKPNVKKFACITLLLFFAIDFAYSKYHPNTGEGISTPVSQIVIEKNETIEYKIS